MTGSLSPFTPFWGTERDIPNFCLQTRSQQQTNLDFFTLAQKVSFHASVSKQVSRAQISLCGFSKRNRNEESVKITKKPFSFHEVPLPTNTSLKTRPSPLCLLCCALRMATERGKQLEHLRRWCHAQSERNGRAQNRTVPRAPES